ncbi:hypothetical protein AKJ35_01300 [candidate division MSBL1 archaeon SCGC-AAA833F18]|uniref:PKD domain-containing protein n=4 Tax=candidate division MSBL1 TaxID=215777 RepID=A0A133V1V2_9EURY|nr:hypothetical protein AKJ42_00865 [candidate division MSBL1 archaeon SCGC-AAA261C02]KXB04091.1 hypothetical protein AKJ47_00660 [candidate division MSBL1 archaeon SCGC-AAA261G05]KXB04927.1 hypothetical protein AKJ48_00935 [candidate division MSBL1 archaeon SCGC-AAA261O19]KXB09168.1 hypothetical protein AKJ35_01300 [candidate division MSBL1 archaeon SCGC-AAA833F18]
MSPKKILTITIIIILAIGLLWITKPWQKIGGSGKGASPTASFSYSVDNQDSLKVHFTNESSDLDNDITSYSWSFGDESTSTSVDPTHAYSTGGTYTVELMVMDSEGNSDTHSRSVTVKKVPLGYTLFRYAASFQYLNSEDNEPIGDEIFIVYPCPNVDNEPVVANENFTWQLLAHYTENGENVWQVEVDNGTPALMVEPRENAPNYSPPDILNTSHGPKVWLHLIHSGLNSRDALFQNEIARIEAEFLVPDENADKVTLVDNQGGIYFNAGPYSEGYKPIRYSVEVSLSKWVGDTFESLGTFSAIADNLPEYAWIELEAK